MSPADSELRHGLFPIPPRRMPGWGRILQIGLRTLHLVAMGLVLGGIAQGAGYEILEASILLTILSGIGLFLLDLVRSGVMLVQGAGVAVLLKLALLGCGNLWPSARLEWYVAATAVASLGAHMPGSWRHFSFLHGRVLEHRG